MADSKLLNTSTSSSPPPNCAICLGSCSNKCFSDTCMHQFCFNCLLQWSKIKAECPLCKQPFKSIIHNVKSNEEYEEHIVEQPRPVHILDNEQYHLILPHSPPVPSRHHRFHFRTTFTVNTHGENAIQRMLMSHSLTNGITISNYLPHSTPYTGRSRRRPRCTTTNFRRSIYDSNLWASVRSDPHSMTLRFREISPEYFRSNPTSRARLVPWLNRELNALLHENTQDVMQVVDTIMDYLLRYNICSRPFRNLLRSYLGARTDHFVHEFYNFMRSPYDMIGYDRNVNYYERPTTPTPFIDISEDDSSDVMIVEENPEVIEVFSSDSDDDVIMTSSFVPKPKVFTEGSTSRRTRRVSVSSTSADEDQKREEERSKKPKRKRVLREERESRRVSRLPENSSDDDSSSSVLDDVPLAKYLRIKASIGKKLSKRNSQLANNQSKETTRGKKRRIPPKKWNTKRFKPSDIASSSLSKPHCSKYCPRRRDQSSSSSSDSDNSAPNQDLDTRNRRNHNESSSSSSNHTITYKSSIPKLEMTDNSPSRSGSHSKKSFTERMRERYSDMHRNDSSSNEEGPSNEPPIFLSSTREQSTSQPFSDTTNDIPLTVHEIEFGNQGRPRKEAMNRYRQQLMAQQLFPSYNTNQASSSTTSSSSSAYIPSSSRNYQPYSYYNTENSTDLIDLSVKSRIRHENPLTVSCVPPEIRARYRASPPRYYSRCVAEAMENSSRQSPSVPLPSTSYTPYNYESIPNSTLKSEPSYSEYQSEGSTKYWTDLSTQNTSHTNSNDSSYNYQSQQPRKSVIQNSRDTSVPQNEIISPRWSSSNSPAYPCYPENWSDTSD